MKTIPLIRSYAVLALALLVMAPWSGADVLLVPAEYPLIQDAIDAAVDGDEVIVADGVYTGTGNRDLDLGGRRILVRSENGAAATTIDCQGTSAEWHRAFLFQSGEEADSIVEGFTITNGYGGGVYPPRGGGIFCDGASPTIRECILIGNTGGQSTDLGGGIACDNGASPTIADCVFEQNTAFLGAGLFCEDGSPLVLRCTFKGQGFSSATLKGVGFAPTFRECTFEDNSGGALVSYSTDVVVEDCLFIGNVDFGAYAGGAALVLSGGAGLVQRCTFRGNSAKDGGAVYAFATTATMRDCLFEANSGTNGGALHLEDADAKLSHNIFASNVAEPNSGSGRGGALYCAYSDPLLEENVFQLNSAIGTSGSAYGGAVYLAGSHPTFRRNLFRANATVPSPTVPLAESEGGAVFVSETSRPVIGGAPVDGNRFQDNVAHVGMDLYQDDGTQTIDARGNVFTIFPPSSIYVAPPGAFDVSTGTGMRHPITDDVVVSPTGVDAEDGTGPYRTLSFVMSRVAPAVAGPITVRLEPGVYAPSTTGESFPVRLVHDVFVEGAGADVTVLDAEGSGGVVLAAALASGGLSDLTVQDGDAGGGGGIFCRDASPLLEGLVVTGNDAIWGGGILCVDGSSPTILGTTVSQNTATATTYFIGMGGGLLCYQASSPLLESVLVTGNVAEDWGGGLALFIDCDASLRHVTVADNTAGVTGGGLYVADDGDVTLAHSVVWGNAAPSDPQIFTFDNSFVTASWSDIEGGWPGTGNVNADPGFELGGYGLTPGSTCVDGGDPLYEPLGFDAAGGPRWLDGDLDGVMVPDMGAFEFTNASLALTGDPTPGGLVTLDMTGLPGLQITLFLGTEWGSFVRKPFGELFLDLTSTWIYLPTPAVLPFSLDVPIPPDAPAGAELIVQILAYDPPTKTGNFSNPVVLSIE